MNFSRTANRTWRRGSPGAWQVIGWEPGGCAQAQLSSLKVTSANSDLLQPGIPLLSRGAKEYHLYRNESWARLWETGAKRPTKSVFLMLFFPVDFHRAMKLGQRKKNKHQQHTYTCLSTHICAHTRLCSHTRAHMGVPQHTNARARPLALTRMTIKAVHLASCPPPCLVRLLWLTPPVSESLSQSTVVHPNFHGVSHD